MNLHQLRFIRETVRCGFNVTEVAKTLYTSQPGISKAIIEFENELGVKIFERHGKRIKGLTKPGKMVLEIIDVIMPQIENLKRIGFQFSRCDEGQLVIACTHTQARYLLPSVIFEFRKRFPKVHLLLTEGSPIQIANMLLEEKADIAIATESLATTPGLITLPIYDWEHILIVNHDHPLKKLNLKEGKIRSLSKLVKYPIITYEKSFTGRSKIDQVFEENNIQANIIIEAIDSDVIKTYVEKGLGVGIIADVAFNRSKDYNLLDIPIGHIFGKHTTLAGIKKSCFLRNYIYFFLEN